MLQNAKLVKVGDLSKKDRQAMNLVDVPDQTEVALCTDALPPVCPEPSVPAPPTVPEPEASAE